MQGNFTVNRAQTEGFAKVWKTPGGIHIIQTPASIQFATDFANVALKGFIAMCQQQAAQEQAAAKKKSEIVGAEG